MELQKSNILMLGPTGSGKTLLAQTLARLLNVPFAIADATTLTEAGYVGEDVENILLKIIQAADYDIERAQCGIIYIDEIDKITRKSETRPSPGMFPERACSRLFLRSWRVPLPVFRLREEGNTPIRSLSRSTPPTSCLSAAEPLTVSKRSLRQDRTPNPSDSAPRFPRRKTETSARLLKDVMPEDFIKFGLIPEFIGRVPIVVTLNGLDEQALIRILKEPKNSLTKQYHKLFELDGVELELMRMLWEQWRRNLGKKNRGQRTPFHHGKNSDGPYVQSAFRRHDQQGGYHEGDRGGNRRTGNYSWRDSGAACEQETYPFQKKRRA